MTHHEQQVNRTVVRGDAPRRLYGAEARRRIDRELHRAVCAVPVSSRHTDWHYDLRRKRLQAWGGMLRLLDVLMESGAPRDTVLLPLDVLREYVNDQLGDDNPRRAA